jgi:hypothetical protein
MCWHRRTPHPAFLKPPPTLTVYHDLRFVLCYKTRGFIVPDTDYYLCPKCCYELQTLYPNDPAYERINSHFLLDGHQEISLICQGCNDSLLNTQPIGKCDICNREHLNLLTNTQQHENPFSEYRVAVICHRGQDFLFKEDWSLFILSGT